MGILFSTFFFLWSIGSILICFYCYSTPTEVKERILKGRMDWPFSTELIVDPLLYLHLVTCFLPSHLWPAFEVETCYHVFSDLCWLFLQCSNWCKLINFKVTSPQQFQWKDRSFWFIKFVCYWIFLPRKTRYYMDLAIVLSVFPGILSYRHYASLSIFYVD